MHSSSSHRHPEVEQEADTLRQLEHHFEQISQDFSQQSEDNFATRHIGPTPQEQTYMLQTLGVSSLEALIDQTLPHEIRTQKAIGLGKEWSESAVLDRLRAIAAQNKRYTSLIGQGYYGTILPPVIQRNVLENPAWYTAYTPYQPEISQGRLEALFTFQTMIAELTGLDIANASLLDEATAAAEAMTLAHRITSSSPKLFFIDHECHPQTIAVLKTRAEPIGIHVIVGNPSTDLDVTRVFGAIFQYPGTSGDIIDRRDLIDSLHAEGALALMVADPLALTLLTPPGLLGADIAVGSTQRFGLPMGFGGPHAAYIAVRDAYKRHIPGRLVGLSVDSAGQPAYRLALQTREQHIRREKATSNICTAQVLPAVIAAMYAVYHGSEGLKAIALRIHMLTACLAAGLRALDYVVETEYFFDTLTIKAGDTATTLLQRAQTLGINLCDRGAGRIGISLDETSTFQTVLRVWSIFCSDSTTLQNIIRTLPMPPSALPSTLIRQTGFMVQEVFHAYHSETDILRYLRHLADKDLALDRSMIPLGSCTMKLNATVEMMPITWPEFCDLHPFIPPEQARGYETLLHDLTQWLCALSGYEAISFQPNSGAQGEYAGLLAIRHYHKNRGESQRVICLIPESAHGTNPASATMAGMRVVTVRCDHEGNIDLEDMYHKIDTHAPELAAVMVTYPSTHGVFEENIRSLCDRVHQAGGQVYIDGANMNAQVGLARPADYGGDVSHFNLHKTFCIPHGGGGPGMGPIGVRQHLAPYLPGSPCGVSSCATSLTVGPVSATPFGSASILPISWAYMRLMGDEGLKRASQVAILNANYIATRLSEAYPVLYRGKHGRVAHECILDLRPIKTATGVSVDDIAKRLIDYGFHAPTVSFPVSGTFMVEPTESEGLRELDRFCEALLSIRAEIAAIEQGEYSVENSPLRHAPHTAAAVTAQNWTLPYPRTLGACPRGVSYSTKYWSPVGRIDAVYGDRHLVCVWR